MMGHLLSSDRCGHRGQRTRPEGTEDHARLLGQAPGSLGLPSFPATTRLSQGPSSPFPQSDFTEFTGLFLSVKCIVRIENHKDTVNGAFTQEQQHIIALGQRVFRSFIHLLTQTSINNLPCDKNWARPQGTKGVIISILNYPVRRVGIAHEWVQGTGSLPLVPPGHPARP